MSDTPARRMYTVRGTALLLGIGVSTAYELITRGELPFTQVGGRCLVSVATLEDLLGERPPPPFEVLRLASGR